MGIVDSCTYTLRCTKCSVEETGLVVDKGSRWSPSSWSVRARFSKFSCEWISDKDGMPGPKNAKCNNCSSVADVTSSL